LGGGGESRMSQNWLVCDNSLVSWFMNLITVVHSQFRASLVKFSSIELRGATNPQ
jgi:hypothetical protein